MSRWHDADSARNAWADAPDDDEQLDELLTVARGQVVRYAPQKAADPTMAEDSDDVPAAYRVAQLRQAQNIWSASAVDPAGGIGDGADFVLRPHPLDWHVKQLIRPKGGRPHVR